MEDCWAATAAAAFAALTEEELLLVEELELTLSRVTSVGFGGISGGCLR